jgi:hypothetical protein
MKRYGLGDVAVVALVAFISALVGGYVARGSQTAPAAAGKLLSDDKLTVDDWLLGAPGDVERFRRLQTELSGFDKPMLEVGERFSKLHEALTRENYELAVYQWWKIETRIRNAIAKRPKRAANAHGFFLGAPYERARVAFESRDPRAAWAAFNTAKGICQACHIAEQAGYVNQQSVFDLTAPAAYAEANASR